MTQMPMPSPAKPLISPPIGAMGVLTIIVAGLQLFLPTKSYKVHLALAPAQGKHGTGQVLHVLALLEMFLLIMLLLPLVREPVEQLLLVVLSMAMILRSYMVKIAMAASL